jgi:hypothetical protein
VTAKLMPLASRIAALALLVLVVGLLYATFVDPVLDDFAATRQRLAQNTALAERYQQLADGLPGRRAALAELQQHPLAQAGFLASANESLAGAELQSRIKSLVEAAQGELKSTQVLPAQQDGEFRRVGVRGEMSMTLAATQRVIHEIEATPPWLLLDHVDIHSHEAERRRDRNPDIVVLEVSFEVYGYMRGKK